MGLSEGGLICGGGEGLYAGQNERQVRRQTYKTE